MYYSVLPMTEEKKIPEMFLKTISDFYNDSDAIFKEFDEMRDKYMNGQDVMGDFKRFRSKRPSIFLLIYDIFYKEVELEEKLGKPEIEEAKRDKILEFKDRFSDLADEIDLFVLGESGLGD